MTNEPESGEVESGDWESADDDLEPSGGGSRRISLSIPAVIAALGFGLLGGVVLGYAVKAFTTEPVVVIPPAQVIKEGLSAEDMALLCVDQVEPETEKARKAQQRVMDLEKELTEKEAALAAEMAQDQKDEVKRKAAAKKWKAMEADIANLRVQLASAERQRDEIKVKLERTVRDLRVQIKETKKYQEAAKEYKGESEENLWAAFNANAKVEICDRGTRKRHEKCHEAVDTAIAGYHGRFKECVGDFQAVPVLKQLAKKEPQPEFSEKLPEDNKFTRSDWVIIFCDPSLPQSPGNAQDDVDLDKAIVEPDSIRDAEETLNATPEPTGEEEP